MSVKSYKPYTPSRRAMISMNYEEVTKKTPEKSLVVTLKKSGGRNNQGVITCRHIGGGNKTKYRIIDFKRNKDGVVGKVFAIEYDPNRNANIALIHYLDGEKRYIIKPQGLNVGDTIVSGDACDIVVGNAMLLKNIPEGTVCKVLVGTFVNKHRNLSLRASVGIGYALLINFLKGCHFIHDVFVGIPSAPHIKPPQSIAFDKLTCKGFADFVYSLKF